jgi:hypothetical protein
MKAPARSQIVSSFTLIKGAMIEETYSVLTGWDFALSNRLDPGRLRPSPGRRVPPASVARAGKFQTQVRSTANACRIGNTYPSDLALDLRDEG